MPNAAGRTPRKLTVTRVAALRSRELTLRGVDLFHRATRADGADQSGLTHLTYAQMANYACDAALAVALANTLFLVKPEEGPARVLLYLLITVAPFAVVAPLDRRSISACCGALPKIMSHNRILPAASNEKIATVWTEQQMDWPIELIALLTKVSQMATRASLVNSHAIGSAIRDKHLVIWRKNHCSHFQQTV